MYQFTKKHAEVYPGLKEKVFEDNWILGTFLVYVLLNCFSLEHSAFQTKQLRSAKEVLSSKLIFQL